MKTYALMLLLITLCSKGSAQKTIDSSTTQQELNKQLAINFFKDLWFSNNTSKYSDYVADSYIVHDIGDRKGVTEPAIEQKHIADFFWENGAFDSKIDYQIAEGDLVATRWTGSFKGNTLFGRLALETKKPISIINVFRIKNGKIVEFWNHRHDIDTPQTMKFTLKGLLFGLFIALIPTILAIKLKRKLKRLSSSL